MGASPGRRRLFVVPLVLGAAVLVPGLASAKTPARIEVVEVKGIIDGSVERAVLASIEGAEQQDAALVVLQIDSRGVVDADRTERMNRAVRRAKVPVAAWIGPSGARAENGATAIAYAAPILAMAPGSTLGPYRTKDLRRSAPVPGAPGTGGDKTVWYQRLDAEAALKNDVVDFVEPSLDALITALADKHVVDVDLDDATIRFHKLDIWGRLLHAAAQPSIAYLFLLLALVGIVFELFHPSNGPAGLSGLLALALSVFGIVTLGGSWLGFALIVAGVVGFSIDLRYESIGLFTLLGVAGLIAGSLLLFPGPYLRVSTWVLAFGIVAMTMFMLGAMTRVLRDLRAIARGELQVTDAHPHPNGQAAGGQPNGNEGGIHGS
jgi:membrane-bound serine protease (ClpP class)